MQAYEFHTIVQDGVIQVPERNGWAEAAKEFAGSSKEDSFFPDFFEDEDLSWWQWEKY